MINRPPYAGLSQVCLPATSSASGDPSRARASALNIALWIAQVGLALVMVGVGSVHAFRDERAVERLPWMAAVGRRGMAVIGILEILGAIGLIAPAVTGVLVWLTPFAAAMIALLMAFAIVFHWRRGERFVGNVFLLVAAAVVAYGRVAISPF